jgi:hypothetical protein
LDAVPGKHRRAKAVVPVERRLGFELCGRLVLEPIDQRQDQQAMGDAVVTHYARAAEVELEDFNRVVTDYEIARGFEKA